PHPAAPAASRSLDILVYQLPLLNPPTPQRRPPDRELRKREKRRKREILLHESAKRANTRKRMVISSHLTRGSDSVPVRFRHFAPFALSRKEISRFRSLSRF